MATTPLTPLTPAQVVSSTPLTHGNGIFQENGIWKRIRDSGFDEDSIRRRDKSSLIAYIAKLESEIYDLQQNMGALILEAKDYASKYEDARLSTEKAEVKQLHEQVALSSALSEARKREDNLKKSLGVEKECVANIEKAMHELRAECAEVKIAAESKMAEAHSLVEDTQQKYIEAEVKLRAAESLRDEARRSERAAARKLQEVEAREDDLRRRITSFKSDCDAKEKELILARKSLAERQRVLSESQNKLLDSQVLLNQREADILSKSQALKKLERDLKDNKENIATEAMALAGQKSNLELNSYSLSEREKVVVEKEVSLNKKEQELILSQEILASKKQNEIQKIVAEQEIALRRRRDEFDVELLGKQKLVEENIEKKLRAWELRELDLKQREDTILENEQAMEVQSRVIADKGKDLAEKIKNMQEKEYQLSRFKDEVEQTKSLLQKEREDIENAKIYLENSLISLAEEKKQIFDKKLKLELMKNESGELLVLETKLKEEIDTMRAQKQQLDSETEKLTVEKAKFETEWEAIDVKREELQREEESIAVERLAISNFLKDERDSLNQEKEALREQYKRDLESLTHDREAFMTESERERSDWFSNFQKERADLLLEIECQKRELEDCVCKRREEIESYLREKERKLEGEKKRDLRYISSLKEDLIKEQERVDIALKKFEAEKLEIKMDREQRDKAWAELQNLIEELQLQRLKLKEQREMLHADREEILRQIEQLEKLANVEADFDRNLVSPMQKTYVNSTPQVIIHVPPTEKNRKLKSVEEENAACETISGSSVSWLKKCTSLVFKHPSEKVDHIESSFDPVYEGSKLSSVEKELFRIDEKMVAPSTENAGHPGRSGSEEAKVIHEVPSTDEEAAPVEVRDDVEKSFVLSQMTRGTRKRRNDSSSAPETDSDLQRDANTNKKRRQEGGDAHHDCVKSKVAIGTDQHGVSSSSINERSIEKVIKNLAEVEKQSNSTSELVDTGISHTQVLQSAVDKSVVIQSEALTCITMEQSVIQEVHEVKDGEPNWPNEKAPYVEVSESEQSEQSKDPSDTNVDKPDVAKTRGWRRSKSKKKV